MKMTDNENQANEDEQVDAIHRETLSVKQQYGEIMRELRDILNIIDSQSAQSNRLFGAPTVIKKGRKFEHGWNLNSPDKKQLQVKMKEAREGLKHVLRYLDTVYAAEKTLGHKKEAFIAERAKRDEKTKIDNCPEKIRKIIAKFHKIWVRSVRLEERKEAITKIDRGFEGFAKDIREDAGTRFTPKNVKKAKAIKEMLNELNEINKVLLPLIAAELSFEQGEIKFAKEEEELLKYLVRGMKVRQEGLKGALKYAKGRAPKLNEAFTPYNQLDIPPALQDGGTHFATDLTEQEERILHNLITPAIIKLYNETLLLRNFLVLENKQIKDFSELIESISGEVQQTLGNQIINAMKELRQTIEKEKTLFEKITRIQKTIEKAIEGITVLEGRREEVMENATAVDENYNTQRAVRRRARNSAANTAHDPDNAIQMHRRDALIDNREASGVRGGSSPSILTGDVPTRGPRPNYSSRRIRNK